MFEWLKRLWYGRGNDLTFKFFDGRYSRRVCPLAAWRSLEARLGYGFSNKLSVLDINTEEIDEESREHLIRGRVEVVKEFAEAVRVAFDIRMIEDGGLSDVGCMRLMAEYLYALIEIERPYRPLISLMNDGVTIAVSSGDHKAAAALWLNGRKRAASAVE